MKERIKSLLKREAGPEKVIAEGWVRTKRDSKNVCFLEINYRQLSTRLLSTIIISWMPSQQALQFLQKE